MMESNISSYPHPAILLTYLEAVSRYTKFFDTYPEYIPRALEAFVDFRGLHNPDVAIRSRANYHFQKFVRETKTKLAPYAELIIKSLQDVLVIEPAIDTPQLLPLLKASSSTISLTPEDPAAAAFPMFDTQKEVFEAVGVLVSLEFLDVDSKNRLFRVTLVFQ
ncbi:hypothetical protein HK096_002830, partial [Nowakowskiella sp. JEL0078]